MPISQTEGYFENTYHRFLEEHMLFLLALKWNLKENAFSSVKTKTNPNFALKLAGRSNRSFLLFYLIKKMDHVFQRSVLLITW